MNSGKICSVLTGAWLKHDDQFMAGEELFRSDRRFSVWAYTISHSQLLLRSLSLSPDGTRRPRIDVLFKPVRATKIRMDYDGLVIRCATTDEQQQIFTETSQQAPGYHAVVLQTPTGLDYVITMAMGWREDHDDDRDPSSLAFFPPGTDPTRLLPQ